MARRTGGATELTAALLAKGFLRLGSPDLEERKREAEEQYRAAEATGDLRALGSAARAFVTIELQSGDRSGFDAALEQVRRLGEASRARALQSTVLSWDAAVALAEGRFDDAKRLGAAARDAAAGTMGFGLYYNIVVVAARLEQGRHGQVIPGLERFVETATPFGQAYRAVLITAYAEAGRLDAARRELDAFAERGFSRVARDWSYQLVLRHLAESCAWLDAREHALGLESLVAPYIGCLPIAYAGSTIEGAADRALGQLLVVQGRLDEAVERYEAALALETAFGAPALAARTRYWWARALAERGKPGDSERARELVANSMSEAHRMGMQTLEREAAAHEAMLRG